MVSLPRALSKLGICSRTQAAAYVEDGRVEVNGLISRDPALRVSLHADRIRVDGKPISETRESIVIALHKPAGYVTTRSDPQGRRTVYELLPKVDRFVFPVGRLDRGTSGLLLFTDDHRLGEALTNPDRHVPKTYEVVVDRIPDQAGLAALRQGLAIGRGEVTRPAIVEVPGPGGPVARLRIVLVEGRNRQVRRMLSAVGVAVVELTRVGVGSLGLGGIPVGGSVRLPPSDVAQLLADARRSQ